MQRDDDLKPAGPRPGPSLARPADAERKAAPSPEPPPRRRFETAAVPSVAMPKGGGALRGLGETFKVNAATGTASFSVPLPISAPGRVLPPALSLGYDGGAGQGPFGAGFSLSAPQIARKTDKKVPEYLDSEDSDLFVLSGAEDLVPMLDAQGARLVTTSATERRERFRPRVEGGFSLIERVTTLASGEVHWSATSRDDTTSLFGTTAASRIADPAQPKRVFSWLLARTTDDRGNVVEYDYVAEDLTGLPLGKPREAHRKAGPSPVTANRYLKRVRYGNTVVGDASSCKLELVFDYGDHPEAIPTPTPSAPWPCRQDPFSTYRAGFEIRSYRLCRRVLMFHRYAELPLVPLLVRALELTYDESPRMTRLTGLTERGYGHDGATYTSLPLPTLSLTYTSDAFALRVRDLGPNQLGSDYPARQMGSSATWVDLDGEGLPGVLIDDSAGHRYKSSRGARKLHAGRVLSTRPAIASGRTQLVDVAGAGTLSLVMTSGGQPGFQERAGDGWAPFLPFKAFPAVDLDSPNVRFMDLNGDGIADLIVARGTHLEWHPSQGRAGYGPARRIPISGDLKKDPSVVFADERNAVLIADMSGDGLPDLVRVTWSGVMYWPNLGHGKFGPAVTMDTAPVLDDSTQFDARRVRLADLDGSGTADLLYFHATKGLSVYRNQAGNSFSEPTTLPVPPEAARGALIDHQGNGTTSLVYDVQGLGPLARAIDFVEAKPHLLAELDNACGQLVRLEHGTSTQHYLRDRLAGRPWPTKLPFPVHVVDKVETYDAIAKTRLITQYTYHHGHYDSVEREFRGFGRVDQTDAERVGATHGKGLFPDYPDPINGETPLPPILTKTWFSTGAWRERSAQTAAYAAEQWTGDSAAPAIPGPVLPAGLPPEELREAHRAHRGQLLRQEIYALDGTPAEAHPYLVTETAVEVRRLQPRHPTSSKRPAHSGVFHLIQRETRSWAYDRDPTDPRLTQTLALDVDPYGAVTRSAALAYPRRFTSTHPEQNALHCVVDETDLLHLDATPAGHRLAIPLEARTYHLTGQTPPLLGAPLERASVRQSFLAATEIAPHESPTTGLQKRLLGREKARYYQSSALPALHPFGQADPRALLYQTYKLDLTDALITQVYGSKLTPAILSEGHYLTPAGETGHWIPSDVATFEPAHFYLPTSFSDPFGAVTSVQYDAHHLFPTEITDDLGNTTTAEHDYAALQPAEITDPNGNRTQAQYNALGLLTEIALMGKIGSSDGDTLADPTIKLSYDLTPASGTPRSVKTEAREKHGPTNTRWHTTIVPVHHPHHCMMTCSMDGKERRRAGLGSRTGLSQKGPDRPLLEAEAVNDGHDALGEETPAETLRAVGDLAPEHEGPERTLRRVVGGVDAVDEGEGEEGGLVLEDIAAGAGDLAHVERNAAIEVQLEGGQHFAHHALIAAPREGSVADAVPAAEHRVGQQEQVVADLCALVLALGERDELADQVRPADLPRRHGPEAELGPAIGHEDAGERANQGRDGFPGGVPSHEERRDEPGRDGPQRSVLAVQSPGARVHVLDRLGSHEGLGFCDRLRKRRARPRLRLAERAQRDRDAEYFSEKLAHLATTHARADQVADEGLQSRPEHVGGHLPWQPRPRRPAAASAARGVHSNLVHVRPDLGDVDDLVDARRQLARREVVASTPMARPRPHLRPLRHLLGRQQDSLVTLVTGLPTALAARCLFRRPRSRRIARRRLVRIGRVLPELTLQLCDSTLQARDLGVPSRKDLQQVSHLGLQPADALVRRRHTANRSCRDPPVDPPRHMITYGHQVADPVNGYPPSTTPPAPAASP
jgi:YD repeat-containing protein